MNPGKRSRKAGASSAGSVGVDGAPLEAAIEKPPLEVDVAAVARAWPARGLSGFHAGARTVPFVSALILTSVWVSQHVFFRVLVPCAPVLLAPLIHLFCVLLDKPAFPGWTHLPRDKTGTRAAIKIFEPLRAHYAFVDGI